MNAGNFSTVTQRLLEQEKLRRLIDQFLDRVQMPAAVQELTNRGMDAVPALLDALERREIEIRHIAHRILEQFFGEPLLFDAAAADDIRLRQAAHIRVRFEKRKSA